MKTQNNKLIPHKYSTNTIYLTLNNSNLLIIKQIEM